ncbi:MAG: DUF4129 domain-containing protein [Microbacterium sp.]
MVLTPILGALAAVPPLIPDGEEAREWAERELSDPIYAIAEPTLSDRVAQAIGDFIARLFSSQVPAEWGPALAVIAAVVLGVIILAAFLVWGVPRATRRAPRSAPTLFGETETRSADELRRAAASRAAAGEWDAAIVLRFRALARGTTERGVVETAPGATVHGYARAAAKVFPSSGAALEEAAAAFDDVRYLRRPGTADLYARVARVDDEIVTSRPVSADLVGAGA